MSARYDIRKDPGGWTVLDTLTGQPAFLNNTPQTGLPLADADDLADLLSKLDAEAANAPRQ